MLLERRTLALKERFGTGHKELCLNKDIRTKLIDLVLDQLEDKFRAFFCYVLLWPHQGLCQVHRPANCQGVAKCVSHIDGTWFYRLMHVCVWIYVNATVSPRRILGNSSIQETFLFAQNARV